MGYSAYASDCSFRIASDKLEPARKAVVTHESFYGNEKSKTLSAAMEDWLGWELDMDEETGDAVGIRMVDGSSKITEEDDMFAALAPFVEAGSWIEMVGEDNCLWRYVFDGEKCSEEYPEIVWDPWIISKIGELRREREEGP